MSTFCKFETALEILVGKWKPVILLRLFSNGTMRFSELQKAIPEITKKMLTQQLRWNTPSQNTVKGWNPFCRR